MNQQQQQSSAQQFRRGVNWILFIARALAVSVEVFLHQSRSFGERYMGLQTGAAVLILFVYPMFWQGHEVGPQFGFLLAFLMMCCIVRVATIARRLRGGAREHSYYSGRPRLMRFVSRMNEMTIKGAVEPMLVFLAGRLVSELSKPLGHYLMLASLGLFISVQVTRAEDRQRTLDLHDASMDQRRIMDQWRTMRRD